MASASSWQRAGQIIGQLGGAHEVRAADLVAGLEVVEGLVARHRLHDRERLAVEDRHGQVAALHVALEQHLRVVGEGRDERGRHVLGAARELDAERRALARGLHHDRELEPLLDGGQRLGRAELAEGGLVEGEEGRGRDAGLDHQVLGEHLVGGPRAGRGPGARVRHAGDLEQLLDGAVLAVASVHRHERHVRPRLAQARHQVRGDVDPHHVVPEPLERVLHARAGAQRHRPLERAAALEHHDPAHPPRARRSRSARPGSGSTRAPSSAALGRLAAAGTAGSSPVSVP